MTLGIFADNIVVDFSEGPRLDSAEVLVPALFVVICVVVLAYFALRSSDGQEKTEIHRLIGETGKALQNIADTGQIYVRGEIWNAKSVQGIIHKDDLVVVVGAREGLVLEVKKKTQE